MHRSAIVVVLMVVSLLVGSVLAESMEDKLTYQGNKARISVGRIKTKANNCSGTMASSFGEMLSTALTNNPRFIVLASGEDLGEIMDEIRFAEGGAVEAGKGAEAGLMEGADVLITGSVTMFEPDARGGKIGLGGTSWKNKLWGGTNLKLKKAIMGLDLKLIDIRQRRVIFASAVEGKSTSWGVGGHGGGWGRDGVLHGGLGVYSNSPMEKAIRVCINNLVEEIANKLPSSYYRYKGKGKYTQEYGQSESQTQTTTQPASQPAKQPPAEKDEPPKPTPAPKKTIHKADSDFVSGQNTLWVDDLSEDEMGEFPFNHKLDRGNFEIVNIGGEKWIMATTDGKLMPNTGKMSLPEQWTLEMDVYKPKTDTSSPYVTIHFFDSKGSQFSRLHYFCYGGNLDMKGKNVGRKDMDVFGNKGVHHIRLMVSKRSIKAYIDDTRVANVPNHDGFSPASFAITIHGSCTEKKPFYFRGFRIAEGGK